MSAFTLLIALSMATTAPVQQTEDAAYLAKLERAYQQQKNTPSVQQIVEASRKNYKTYGSVPDSARRHPRRR